MRGEIGYVFLGKWLVEFSDRIRDSAGMGTRGWECEIVTSVRWAAHMHICRNLCHASLSWDYTVHECYVLDTENVTKRYHFHELPNDVKSLPSMHPISVLV